MGAGTLGTALGNVLAGKADQRVVLHTIEEEVARTINHDHVNEKYFPTFLLQNGLTATTRNEILRDAAVLFLAIPSGAMETYFSGLREYIGPHTHVVNLAKGFACGHMTVVECLKKGIPNAVSTLKGPTFAREIINNIPTGFTLGHENPQIAELLRELFRGTCIHLDYSSDLRGVEILSILKNMYAIVLGIIDAQFNSPNIRFLILTKAFREMRKVLLHFGGREETLFSFCGYGDFTLTALNDLSRNRTLGLLIGKGFFTEHISHELVLEGKTAVQVFYEELAGKVDVEKTFPILTELYRVLYHPYPISRFAKTILEVGEA